MFYVTVRKIMILLIFILLNLVFNHNPKLIKLKNIKNKFMGY